MWLGLDIQPTHAQVCAHLEFYEEIPPASGYLTDANGGTGRGEILGELSRATDTAIWTQLDGVGGLDVIKASYEGEVRDGGRVWRLSRQRFLQHSPPQSKPA